MNRSISILVSVALACSPGVAAQAHHSASAYDESKTASVSGVVTRLQWRNPHVIIRLEVEGPDGSKTQWPLESAGIQQMIRDGWNKELVGPGQRLTAEIHPTKTGVPGGILRWVTLADGRVLAIDSASPTDAQYAAAGSNAAEAAPTQIATDASADETTVADPIVDGPDTLQNRARRSLANYKARRAAVEQQEASNRPAELPKVADEGQAGALDPDNRAAHKNVALFDFTGVWQHRSFRELSQQRGGMPWEFLPLPKLTPKAAAIRAENLARREAGDATADPAALCYPHGLQRTMTRVGNMMLLQVDTAVFMVHRMNNDFRAVYWDGRDHVDPSVRVDTYNGDSIAYWADDHLYVETVGFGSPFHYINPGVPIGAQGKVEERWRLINDGNTLEIEFRMTDPEHWEGEWIDTKFWDRIYGADIREANCILAEDAELAIGRQ